MGTGTIVAAEALRLLDYLRSHPRRPDVEALRIEAGLPGGLDGEQRVDIRRVWELWGAAVRRTDDPGLPIRFGAVTRLEDMGVLGLSLITCTTTREALRRSMRYQHLLSDSGRWELAEGGGVVRLRWLRDGPLHLGHRAANETVLAEQVAGWRQVIGDVAPLHISFRHAAPRDIRAHRDFFRCSLSWGAGADELVVDARLLDCSPRGGNAALDRHFEEILRQRDAELAALTTLGDRVRAVVRAQLDGGEPSVEDVARQLGTSERTLRRQLVAEGERFSSILDEVRRARAEALLAQAGATLTDIAFALGFSEQSAFSRAFRRWFGVSPRAYRQTRPGAGAGRQGQVQG